jgi:hypothetical protein
MILLASMCAVRLSLGFRQRSATIGTENPCAVRETSLHYWLTCRSLSLGRVSPYPPPQKFHTSLQFVKQEIAQEFDDRRLFILPGEHIQLDEWKRFQAGYPVVHG